MAAAKNEVKDAGLQRCAVIHLALKEIATGSGTDEAASLAELAEAILYFYESDGNSSEASLRSSPDAIRFVGIASAFWSLPTSLGGRTPTSLQTVALSESSLLLIPLEDHVLAVFQFAKDARVTPEAVAAATCRHYQLFCLCSGGGIDYRLRGPRTPGLPQEKDGNSIYPGMRELFDLYRQKRKLLYRIGDSSVESNSVKPIEEELQRLGSTLPIHYLRRDLREHFDIFCADWESNRSSNPAYGRSIIHRMPSPVPGSCSTYRLETVPEAWKESIRAVLENKHGEGILGVSAFAHGQFQETMLVDKEFKISTESHCLLMHYLSSIREQIPADHEPAAAGFLRRTLGGLLKEGGRASAGFLAPPPLSMLNVSVQEAAVCVLRNSQEDDETNVWIPLMTLCEIDRVVRICLYSIGDFDFIVYLDPDSDAMHSHALNEFSQRVAETSVINVGLRREWDRVGQDVIWVDRRRHRTLLCSCRKWTKKSASKNHPDERYQLASHLSLDTLLALDQAIDSAVRAFPRPYNCCTLLRQNWLVCHSRDGVELYVVLDGKQYVTIHDVEGAIDEIQQDFPPVTPY
jgi:hypothetical protein